MAIINNRNINNIRDGFSHFYPDNPADFVDGPYQSGDFTWKDREGFKKFVFDETKVNIKSEKDFSDIKAAQQTFEKRALTPEEAAPENMPEDLKAKEEALAKREAARQEAIAKASRDSQQFLDNAKKLHDEAAKIKPKYVKADYIEPESNSDLEEFKTQAKNSKNLYPVLKDQIKRTLDGSLPNLTEEQREFLAKDAASKAIDAVINPEKYINIASQSAILQKVSTDASIPESVRAAAADIATIQNLQTMTARTIVSSINPNLSPLIPWAGNVQTGFSDIQGEGYGFTFNAAGLMDGYQNLLGSQFSYFQGLSGLPLEKIQGEIMQKAGGLIEDQVVKYFPELVGAFDSKAAQTVLAGLGFGKMVVVLPEGLSLAVSESPQLLTLMNFGGSFLGVSFEAGSVAATVQGTAMAAGTAEGAAAVAGGALTGPGAIIVIPLLIIAQKVVGKVIKNVASKAQRFLKENGLTEAAVAVPAAVLAGIFLGPAVGIGIGLGTLLFTSFLTGGGAGIRASLTGIGSGVGAFTGTLWATFLAGIGAPILGFLIGFPILVVFILFIINSGALIVPPGVSFLNSTNPYIDVQKTAKPSGKLASPQAIIYTVTITAKKDALSAVSIKPGCRATKKGGRIPCPAEQIPSDITEVSAGSSKTFTFTVNYGPQFQDALVSNTVNVSAKSNEGGKVSDSATSSVCFGNCPLNCFAFPQESWPKEASKFQGNLTTAAADLAGQYANFAAKICGNGETINLCYTTINPSPIGSAGICNGATYARHIHTSSCDIVFNQCGLRSESDALYILTHEATHHLQKTDPSTERDFEQNVPKSEWPICTYGLTRSDPYESMAEGNALFIGTPSWSGCITSYLGQYPKHYQFAKSKMFGQ